jgi:methyl-accepting chemotaxis protein
MLNDMKIGARLVIVLVTLMVSMLVIGGLGLYNASRGNHSMHALYTDRMLAAINLGLIDQNMLYNRLAIANAVIHPEQMKANAEEVKATKELIDKEWAEYMAAGMYDDEKKLAADFVENRAKFVEQYIKPAVAEMESGESTKLGELNSHGKSMYVGIKKDINELIQLQEREATKIFEQSDAEFGVIRMVSIVLIVLGGLLGVGLGLSIIRGINTSVGDLRGAMVKMSANGDLTARAKVHGKDEIGEAATAFNSLIEGFAGIIRQVNDSAGSVSNTAAQLSVSSAQIARGSQTQSEAAASTAAAVEEITVSINSVAANTEDVRKLSEKSLQQTQLGNKDVTAMIGEIGSVQDAVNQIAGSVKEFVDSTRAISGMTQQVKDIADQTNLLALNAAIEAARAGEQGRGFAVVADEVRKLAEKSAKSASEIDQVTNSLNLKSTQVEAVVQNGLRSLQATQEQVERVATVLTAAGEAVMQSSHGVSDIASSVSEQSLASTEIARNVEKIAQMSEENHAAVNSNSNDIVRLEGMAKELKTAVGRFRV